MFYTFRQNNSGGEFDYSKENGITKTVIIEADTTEDAINNALFIGLYFNGCASGFDCACCGDRWSTYDVEDGGHKVPSVYGKEVGEDFVADTMLMNDEDEYGLVIHYKDGKKVWK